MLRSPGPQHQRAMRGLLMAIHGVIWPTHRGMVLAPSCGVVLGEWNLVQPDLMYIAREHRHIISNDYVRDVPDLVAEIISRTSSTLDQVVKRNLYAKHGVKYYWIIEPLAEWIRAYELGADGLYELVAEAHGREIFSASPFADLQVELATLWADPIADA